MVDMWIKIAKDGHNETHKMELDSSYVETSDIQAIGVQGKEYLPIVRCDSCRHYDDGWCGFCDRSVLPDWFCSNGEKKQSIAPYEILYRLAETFLEKGRFDSDFVEQEYIEESLEQLESVMGADVLSEELSRKTERVADIEQLCKSMFDGCLRRREDAMTDDEWSAFVDKMYELMDVYELLEVDDD